MAPISTEEDIVMDNKTNSKGYNIEKEIEKSINSLKKAAANFDNRYITNVFRDLVQLRPKLNQQALESIFKGTYQVDNSNRQVLLEAIGSSTEDTMDVDDSTMTVSKSVIPEVDLYLHLLAQLYLFDSQKLKELDNFNNRIIELMSIYNRRMLDFIQAKIWFYIARTKEFIGDMYSIRAPMLLSLRTATLRHDTETQASIITLLLRNYLLTHDISQAYNIAEKTVLPDNTANSISARYYYYLAKISAIQLDYSSALNYVMTAIRKAPQTTKSKGFIATATKLSVIVELLTGDIPELATFKNRSGNFEAYFMVSKAVRMGNLKLFESVLSKYESVFIKDDLFTLVSRLRQNVIKTGIRIISLSYSKISLKDICIKLHLDSEESTEYIVAKAIRDGVIEASINHEKGYMQSKELPDMYSTSLPQSALDQRIQFCLSLYNDSVKSMRYPADENKPDFDKFKSDSKEDEFDILKAIEEGDLDEFLD